MITGVIFNALGPLVNNRCYPSAFPQEDIAVPGTSDQIPGSGTSIKVKPTWPAIRYTITDAQNEATTCGTDTVDTDNTTVQIDVVALTHGGMLTLRDQVILALQTTDPPCYRQNLFELKDSETKTHRAVLIYEFHASTGGVSP